MSGKESKSRVEKKKVFDKKKLSDNKLKQALMRIMLEEDNRKLYVCCVCAFERKLCHPFTAHYSLCSKCNKDCCSVGCSIDKRINNDTCIVLCLKCCNHPALERKLNSNKKL